MLLMGCIVALLILLAEPMTRLFYRDPSDPVYQMTVMGFRILPLCMPPAMLSLHFASYTQTMEKRIMSVILPVVDGMVGVVLFSFLLIPPLKMNGLYIANILNGILCFIVIAAGAWIILKRCPRTLEDLMAIPVGFGVPADKRIDITVRSMEEVMNVSRQITDFCSEQGIDPRRTFLAGLCMEEMAGNVVTHGFSKDTKQHSADIRVAYKGDEIILRIRDNCRAFNPSEWIKVMEPGELGRNVGIQLVWQMASDVSYQNLLGLNVLTIRL